MNPNSHFCYTLPVTALLLCINVQAQEQISWVPGTILSYVELDGWKKEVNKWDLVIVSAEGSGFNVIEKTADKEIILKVQTSGVFTRPMPTGNETFDYQPVKLPLAAGSTWEYVYHYIGKNTGAIGRTSSKCEAISIEEVEVPAGKFNAWKITCRGGWVSTAGSSGSLNKTIWFAPTVSAIVKSNDRTSYFGGSEQFFTSLIKVSKP